MQEQATGIKHKFIVTFITDIVVELDEALMPDDEWRRGYYNYRTLRDMAGFIAHNHRMGWEADDVDGLCGLGHLYRIVDEDTYLDAVDERDE